MKNIDEIFDFSDDDDVLGELEDMFDFLSIEGPNSDEMYEMYGKFLNDFISNPIIIDDEKLKVNTSKSRNPICKNKMMGFEHIITRESKLSGKRVFDRQRANKIHWIKPIIENKNDFRIKYFEAINDKGYNQLYYWYEEKGFIVIIREINPHLLLITSFTIDKGMERKFKKMYNEYR